MPEGPTSELPRATSGERLGIFGGTFDPVHVGHVVVAAEVRARLGLDRLLVLPAGDPWQKQGTVVATGVDRLAMVEAAMREVTGVEPGALEVERPGASVTADTLEALSAPGRELFLVLGADTVRNMGTWRRLEATKELATIVVVERAGDPHARPPGEGWRFETVAIPRLDVSSTDLRDRLSAGLPVDGLIPPTVISVIRARGLYTGG